MTKEELIEFKEMECPVCHKYYFVDDTELEKNDPSYIGPCQDQCTECGWIYDLEQTNNPNLANKSNVLSLNEYKKMYEDLVRNNPNYNYSEANYVAKPHLCPICGKYKFKDDNSFDICPFCGWEDDCVQLNDPDLEGGANELSLNQYKNKYNESIKKLKL